jgi:putative YphP/YqiW family bacilliredoxin
MPYPELMVAPMRQELKNLGVQELRSAAEVDQWMRDTTGSAVLVINSVCGCAAGACRPAVAHALQQVKPDHVATVFAGQDVEATQQARSYFAEIPPSSPSILILNNGQLVEYIPRHRIERRPATDIAQDIVNVVQQLQAKA